jgi:hypothetical protein
LALEQESSHKIDAFPSDIQKIREFLLNGDFREVSDIFSKAKTENPSIDLGQIPFQIKKQQFLELLSKKVRPFITPLTS